MGQMDCVCRRRSQVRRKYTEKCRDKTTQDAKAVSLNWQQEFGVSEICVEFSPRCVATVCLPSVCPGAVAVTCAGQASQQWAVSLAAPRPC